MPRVPGGRRKQAAVLRAQRATLPRARRATPCRRRRPLSGRPKAL